MVDTSIITKLAGLQNIIPQFDNCSAVTPNYFLETFEAVTEAAKCTDSEKLMIIKSRIRGDALSHIINSPDLAEAVDYKSFVAAFRDFFTNKSSLVARHQSFSNVKMTPSESVKVYASRVSQAVKKIFW